MSGMRATTPLKADLARQMRATAGKVDQTHPETVAGQHLRKAATLVSSGQHDGAKRHLDAAMELMTPRNLIRHGITDDEGHATAKQAMHQINVHRLGVMDVQDTEARNEQQAGAKRDSIAQQAQQRAAKLQAAAAAAAKQAVVGAKTAAKPTGTGPGSQVQTGPPPDPILATATPTRGGLLLSAQTAVLERTPHPNGKPGGPGLYGKAGNKHSDYFEQIVHALMTRRGMTQAQASAIAWSRLRKWSAGGGKVHPEVRAAAAGALGQEQAAKLSWDTADRLIELACGPVELAGFNPAQPRVAAGSAAGGQFGGGSGGSAQPGGKGNRAQRRARLVRRAVSLRGQIAQLLLQIHAARHPHHKSKSATPRKKGAAAASAKAAAASKAAARKSKAGTKRKTTSHSMTLPQMLTQLAVLRAELHTVMQQIHHLANEERAAIELSYKDAWRHELRGPHGQFVSGGGGPRTVAAQARVRHQAVRNAMIRRGGHAPATAHAARSLRSTAGAPASDQAAAGLGAAPGKLHPEVEHRVKQIAQQLDTGVQQTASKDAAAKARTAAQQAQQALTHYQAEINNESKHGARIKFATEAGVAIASAVVTWIEAKTGTPGVAMAISAPSILFVQLIIEWIKRL